MPQPAALKNDSQTPCILFWGFLLAVFVFILWINSLMPLVGEDYTNSPWGYHASPASLSAKFATIYDRLENTTTLWTPRVGEHLAIILAVFPKAVFNIINALVFDWLLVVLFSLAYGRFPSPQNTSDLKVLFLLFVLILGMFPLLGQVFFWKAGATNHLWATVLLFSFILLFRFNFSRGTRVTRWGSLLGLTLLGFFAGLSMENLSPAVFALVTGYFIYALVKKSMKWTMVIPLLVYGASLGYLLFGPGTTAKRLYYLQFKYDGDLTGIHLILNRFYRITHDFVHTSIGLIAAILICLIVLGLLARWKKVGLGAAYRQNKLDWFAMAALLVTSLLAILIMTAAPYQGDQKRAFAAFWFMAIVLLAIFLLKILEWLPVFARNGLLVVLTGFCIFQMVKISDVYLQFKQQNDARVQVIQAALETGQKNVTLPAITMQDSRILETREILTDLGERIAGYYGFDQVVIEK